MFKNAIIAALCAALAVSLWFANQKWKQPPVNTPGFKPRPTTSVQTTTTTISKPDGTVTTTVVEKRVTDPAKRFKAAIATRVFEGAPRVDQIGLGYRLVGPVFVDVFYNFRHKGAMVGVSIEF